jgi:hypothetical protein
MAHLLSAETAHATIRVLATPLLTIASKRRSAVLTPGFSIVAHPEVWRDTSTVPLHRDAKDDERHIQPLHRLASGDQHQRATPVHARLLFELSGTDGAIETETRTAWDPRLCRGS